jgi:hypothetical protein
MTTYHLRKHNQTRAGCPTIVCEGWLGDRRHQNLVDSYRRPPTYRSIKPGRWCPRH